MSDVRSAKITKFFGDGPHDFCMRIGEIEELQELTEVGLLSTLDRITMMFIKDIKEVLRLGLIGGGLDKAKAYQLVTRHVVEAYLIDAASLAGEVVQAALRGAPEDAPGE